MHACVTTTKQWKALRARFDDLAKRRSAWAAHYEPKMAAHRAQVAEWEQAYLAAANGNGKYPGAKPTPPTDVVDLTGMFVDEYRRLTMEQEELLGRIWPEVEPAARQAEEGLLGTLRTSLDGSEPCDWQQVLAELQDLAATFVECAARADHRPFRPPVVTPEQAFNAAWYGQRILATDRGATPTLTIKADPNYRQMAPEEIRAEEAAAPGLEVASTVSGRRSGMAARSRKLREPDWSRQPAVGTGEDADPALVERIRENAAKQAG
jgi:hypothetical protein